MFQTQMKLINVSNDNETNCNDLMIQAYPNPDQKWEPFTRQKMKKKL